MIQLFNNDNLNVMATLENESIDVICIDPPYLYLKGQKLERPFDEQKFYSECKRLLTKDGFIVTFGRGESFYRWNTMLANLGFTFKEEIIWDKSYNSSPLLAISRTHESVALLTKGCGVINRVKVPYLETKSHDIGSVLSDIKRMKSILKNNKSLEAVEEYLANGTLVNQTDKPHKHNTSAQISGLKTPDRAMAVMQAIDKGMTEKTIIRAIRDHYKMIHPTQKPVRLLERLLALVIPKKERKDIVVADFFAGSMSCMEAVHNMGMQGIAVEIDKEFFEAGKERIEKLQPKQEELFRTAV